jgi:two-component system KDP operon response regulator KdpE
MQTCRELRRRFPHVAILILTTGETEDEQVEAFESGADDYIAKPFRMRELLARVRAATRRVKTLLGSVDSSFAPIRIGEIELQPASRLVYKSKKLVHLTRKEFELLFYLMAHSGVPISHAQLLGAVWGTDRVDKVEYLRTFIRQLREKLEEDAATPRYILTHSYFGYRFTGDVSSSM